MGTVDQKWYRSWTTWLAFAGQLLAFLVLLGVIDVQQNDALHALLVVVGEVLTAFGIVNNPTVNHIAERRLKQTHE